LNRYPKLKEIFSRYISQGYFEDVSITYVGGMKPTANFYNEKDELLSADEFGGDLDISQFKEFFQRHGFELKRPALLRPVLSSEITIGNKHYQFFGGGKLYNEDAQGFASSQSFNGQTGRLLTVQCKSEEDKVSTWLKSASNETIEAWLGAYDAMPGNEEGVWAWQFGDNDFEVFWRKNADASAASTYSHWREGEPNNAGFEENCASINPDKEWNDVSCDESEQIVVEYGPRKSSLCDEEPSISHVQSEKHEVEL